MYSTRGRPSIPPEQFLRALLLQILFTVRSEGRLMGRIDCDPLFRWFVGLGMDKKVWDHSVFGKNRDRLAPMLLSARGAHWLASEAARADIALLLKQNLPQ